MVFIVHPCSAHCDVCLCLLQLLLTANETHAFASQAFNFTRKSATQMHRAVKKSCGMCAPANTAVSGHAANRARTYPTQSAACQMEAAIQPRAGRTGGKRAADWLFSGRAQGPNRLTA